MKQKIRVVHFRNTAGVATTLAKYQRRIGYNSTVLVAERHPFGYPGEIVHSTMFGKLVHSLSSVALSDVVHFHEAPYIFHPSQVYLEYLHNIDYRAARKLKKRIVFHFHGVEIRDPKRRKYSSPFFSETLLVATPDLLQYVPRHATWLPYPIDTELFSPEQRTFNPGLTIGYYEPVSSYVRLFAGNRKLIEDATKDIRQPGIRLSAAQNIPWTKMPKYYKSIDVWVDKIGLNFYGVAACEASACEVPVITQIGENELTYLPDCPFLNVKPQNIRGAIEYLYEENTRRYVGRKCLDYVNRVHEASAIVNRLDDVYRS
jgi:hypothetical protein